MVSINQLKSKINTFLKLSLLEKVWLFFLYPLSGLARALILTLKYKRLSTYFGFYLRNAQLSIPTTEAQKIRALRIGKTVELCSRYTFWESKCLVQAIMAITLLKLYRIPYVMHLGATLTNDKDEPMKAHAWVLVGDRVITGRAGHKAFSITATYTSECIHDD
ncbi:lasso peptide biosynthesis B2 protein [Marinomonas mediterranea]|uniref:lasso peptide biosynthesis B2 protein n=1 Tax=Marinomonas mediterranea TaxID=119864 RepID=UPI00234B033D|nr:lasso peptide biosynthesis B2 protein [Marinomonas mediterranea]WCN08577.1 lasso peptide biosynthesis B2 protein [Marinomonas mediterranea]WCN12631.1 lasso peptide biosynthesis B2 protein [Marinomonas mediterranea]